MDGYSSLGRAAAEQLKKTVNTSMKRAVEEPGPLISTLPTPLETLIGELALSSDDPDCLRKVSRTIDQMHGDGRIAKDTLERFVLAGQSPPHIEIKVVSGTEHLEDFPFEAAFGKTLRIALAMRGV